jgi:hypothetical protein
LLFSYWCGFRLIASIVMSEGLERTLSYRWVNVEQNNLRKRDKEMSPSTGARVVAAVTMGVALRLPRLCATRRCARSCLRTTWLAVTARRFGLKRDSPHPVRWHSPLIPIFKPRQGTASTGKNSRHQQPRLIPGQVELGHENLHCESTQAMLKAAHAVRNSKEHEWILWCKLTEAGSKSCARTFVGLAYHWLVQVVVDVPSAVLGSFRISSDAVHAGPNLSRRCGCVEMTAVRTK